MIWLGLVFACHSPQADKASDPLEESDTDTDTDSDADADTDVDSDADADTGALPEAPVAVIEADATAGEIPLTVTFDASSSTGSGLTYAWTWDGAVVGTDAEYVHEWLGSGTETVTLTVTDAYGATDSVDQDIDVQPAACPTTGTLAELAEVTYGPLSEISGIAYSRANPGVLWVHNDTGTGTPRQLHALDRTTGELLGEFTLDLDHNDWEDLAVGTDAYGDPVLFVAATGNNNHDRGFLAVVVVPEPVVPLGSRTDADLSFHEMEIEYPAPGDYDCESIMFDPQTGMLLLLTKSGSGVSHLFKADAPHDEAVVLLDELAVIDFSTAPLSGSTTTAASISEKGDKIVVRTYSSTAWVFNRDASFPIEDAFTTPTPCPIGLISEQQGEAIDFTPETDALITISEGSTPPIHSTTLD